MKIGAVILAAGASSRMGRDKALLPLDGVTALKRVVLTHRRAGVHVLRIVSGSNDADLRICVPDIPVVRNLQPQRGMFSSIQTGVSALPDDIDAFFVHPVDIPLVRPETLGRMMSCLSRRKPFDPAAVVQAYVPTHHGKRGHPPLLSKAFIRIIREETANHGLAAMLHRFGCEEVNGDDPGVLIGMNTLEEYRTVLEWIAKERDAEWMDSDCALAPTGAHAG